MNIKVCYIYQQLYFRETKYKITYLYMKLPYKQKKRPLKNERSKYTIPKI